MATKVAAAMAARPQGLCFAGTKCEVSSWGDCWRDQANNAESFLKGRRAQKILAEMGTAKHRQLVGGRANPFSPRLKPYFLP